MPQLQGIINQISKSCFWEFPLYTDNNSLIHLRIFGFDLRRRDSFKYAKFYIQWKKMYTLKSD